MAKYRISLVVDAANVKVVERKLKRHFSKAASARAAKIELSPTRAWRLSQAAQMINEGKEIVAGLKDELENWYENLPENFQNDDHGQEIDQCRGDLGEAMDCLESLNLSFTFPAAR